MASGIKFTSREMRYIALFESITGATVKDCIVNSDLNKIIFIVKEGDIGMAIGRRGKNIRLLERMTEKRHEVIEHSENPARFIRNALKPAAVDEIRISERPDGKTIAVVSVKPKVIMRVIKINVKQNLIFSILNRFNGPALDLNWFIR